MMFNTIINGFFNIVEWILSLLPDIPAFIGSNTFIDFTDIVFTNLGLIDIIVPIGLLTTCIFGMVGIALTKLVIDIILWIIKKIPLASIE